MRPVEFWQSTPAEIVEMMDGYHDRRDEQYNQLAWLAANIMNATGRLKKPTTPEKLLGRKKIVAVPDRETQSNELKKIAEEFEEAKARNHGKRN